MAAPNHMLVYWDEEGFTSIVKLSQLVQPSNAETGAKAMVRWGQNILLVTILEFGSKALLKKKQLEYHNKHHSDGEENQPAVVNSKKRKREEKKVPTKGKKEMKILRITTQSKAVPH